MTQYESSKDLTDLMDQAGIVIETTPNPSIIPAEGTPFPTV